MPHYIDINSIREDIFLLLNLCYAGEPFSRKHKLCPADDVRGITYSYYFDRLKFLLSEKLIACAIKTRIAVDFLKDENSGVDLIVEDKSICKGYDLGRIEGDSVVLSVREVCNKVIHAESMSPDIETYGDAGDCERWNGWLTLDGVKGQAKWKLHLNLAGFCLALENLVVFLEENYDWHRVYK